MADEEQPKKPSASEKPPAVEELRQMIREDIKEQRQFIRKLRQKMN